MEHAVANDYETKQQKIRQTSEQNPCLREQEKN